MKLPQTWVIKPTTVSFHHSSPVKHFFLWWVWAWIKFHHFSHKNQLLRSRRGMVVCNWEDLSILATWKRETNLTFLWKYRKNLRSRIPQVRSSKNSLSNTLRREVELNLYLLLRGRYQRLHLVPHYILITISLLDKFDTQARCNFFLPPSLHTSTNYCIIHTTSTRPFIPLCPTSNTRTSSLLTAHSPSFWFQKTKSSQFCIQFVKNNTSKGVFQNIWKEATAYAGLALIPTLYRFFKNIVTKSLVFIY